MFVIVGFGLCLDVQINNNYTKVLYDGILLRGCPLGRITRLARPFIRPSVCLSVGPVRAHNSKT